MKRIPIYGLMAEFASAQDLVNAARETHEAGYRKIDAFSPFPVEELADAIGFHKNNVALVTLIGAIVGGLTGYLMQYWMAVRIIPGRRSSSLRSNSRFCSAESRRSSACSR
jgi:hypothetical protein